MRETNVNNVKLQEIQKRLRETIAESGLKQYYIAKKIGVSAQTVSKYMNGNVLPALDTLSKLCILTDVSADYILGVSKE